MDDGRKLKFIKQYNEKLQELLKREENATLKRELSKYFYDNCDKEFTKSQIDELPQKHDPKKIVEYLKKFTENTHIKYSTHLWDGIGDIGYKGYKDFIENLNTDYKTYKFNEFTSYNKYLYFNLINPFLFQNRLYKNPKTGKSIPFSWGKNKNKVGWQFPSKLFLINHDKLPHDIQIPENLKSKNPIRKNKEEKFQDLINDFKSEIEFRRNDLHFLLERLAEGYSSDFKITLNGIKGLHFYTYTSKIEEVLKRILKNMDTNFPEIIIKGIYDSQTVKIEILQKDSYADIPIEDPKLNLSQGDFRDIQKSLISLCDWSVQSRFRGGEYYEIKYLDINKPEPEVKKNKIEEDPKGFKYILTFYT